MNLTTELRKELWAVLGILVFAAVLVISTDVNGLLQPAQVSQSNAQTLLSKVDIDRVLLLKTLTGNLLSNNSGPPQIPGIVDSTGTYFEIKNSRYLDIILKSSEELKVFLESAPKTISLMIAMAENASSAILTIENLTPNKTYYRYQDGYDDLTVSIANSNGSYSWTQDLALAHHVWFQEERSTVSLPNDCLTPDNPYGIWDAETTTCTLNQDINQSVQLTSNNMTLDCNGHSIIGSGTGYGIYARYRSQLTVKDCVVDNFSVGAFFISSSGNTFNNNTVRHSQGGIAVSFSLSANNMVSGNTIEFNNNGFGIRVMGSDNTVTQNTLLNNGGGIELYGDITGNNITQNTINSNNTGIFILNSRGNTFTGNTIASGTVGISFYYYISGTPPNNILRDNILNDNQFNISFDTYAPPQSFIQDIDQSNTINEKPIYYLVNQADQTISGEAGFVGLVNSQRITVKDLILTNNHEGIMLVSSHDSTVENVQLLDNILGILLIDSSGNTFKGTQIHIPESYGMGLYFSSSTDNVIMESDITVSPDTHAVALVGYLNFDNKFYHNNFTVGSFPIFIQGGAGNLFDNGYPDGGNWWSNNTYCQDTKTGPLQNQPGSDGICDGPYNFWGGQDSYPFVEQNGWGSTNQPPVFSDINQYKSDGLTMIFESDITTEDSVTFKAILTDPEEDPVKLQIEVRQFDKLFTGVEDGGILTSDFVTSGSEVAITTPVLVDGQYHWRARAIDSEDNTSDWHEFGEIGNVDFVVKLVPLYTQVESDYPSQLETGRWAIQSYAYATPDKPYPECGWRIQDCGCAITSMVMLGRYYGIDVALNETEVNPENINTWLTSNMGYTNDGRLWWAKAIEYLGFIDETTGKKMVRFNHDYFNEPASSFLIDEYVDSSTKPAIIYNRQIGHYLVIDGKVKPELSDTYTLKDPSWYNTKTLNQPEDIVNKVRGYNNYFSTANLFSYLEEPKQITASIYLYLASPAELFITDPLGRKLGKDPITGISYDEIPGGSYTIEGPIITSEDLLLPTDIHEIKAINLPTPIDGKYDVQIIGTDTGSYTVSILAYDQNGQSKTIIQEGNIVTDNIQTLEFDYSTESIQQTELYRIVSIDIKPGSYPNSINLKSKGVIPVAILADEFFDVEDINVDSILFAGVHSSKGKLEDLDNDSDLDLILHFKVQSLQLVPDDIGAVLTGQLTDDTSFKGVDSVRIISK